MDPSAASMVKFFHPTPEGRWIVRREEQRMDRPTPVDEVRAPGFAAGLIPGACPGRKSKDQRIPSGHAIARTLPRNSRIHPAFPPEKIPGNRGIRPAAWRQQYPYQSTVGWFPFVRRFRIPPDGRRTAAVRAAETREAFRSGSARTDGQDQTGRSFRTCVE
jgi:hypothetical protein